jgi:hypothetical protein
MKCYFDGSVGGKADEWLTLGGLAAPDSTWALIQPRWMEMLGDREPIAPYVHMTDLITGNHGFKGRDGWTKPKVRQLVSDVVNLLGSVPPSNLCAFACAIDVRAHRRLRGEGYQIDPPSVVCAHLGLGKLLEWYTARHSLEVSHLFYDQNEPFIRPIRREWLKSINPKKRIVDDLFWGRIANVQPVLMKDTPGIQAADVIAWSFARRLRNQPNDEWSTLATTLVGNRRQRGILTCT